MKRLTIVSSLLLMLLFSSCLSTLLGNRNEAEKTQIVENLLNGKNYRVTVDRGYPQGGRSFSINQEYYLEVKNDSVNSYLPYRGVAYSVPYGGGEGLIFKGKIENYIQSPMERGKIDIKFEVRNEEDRYEYSLNIFNNGSANIFVQPIKRQSITFSGLLDIDTDTELR